MKVKPNKFQDLRYQLGLTQRSLAAKLGVSQTAISHWERGETYPSIERMAQLAKLAERKGINFKIKRP